MQALIFLFVRTFVNGIRRALSSPRRLISVLVFSLYYVNMVFQPFNPAARTPLPPGSGLHLPFPPMATLDGGVFLVMMIFSIFMMMGLLGYRGSFRPADIDVLFPTPIDPRVVLLFRVARDYFFTLIMPLFFALILGRGTAIGTQFLFENSPKSSGNVLRTAFVTWGILSMMWVMLGYAATMYANRSDAASARNRRLLGGGITALIVGPLVYVGVVFRMNPVLATAFALVHSPVLRTAFFPATSATWVVMGSLSGNIGELLGGLAAIILCLAIGIRLTLVQVSWMYDQAAARGFSAIEMASLRRSGDSLALQAERARSGKLRRSRVSAWVSHFEPRGPMALLWKELLLQVRISFSSLVMTVVIMVGVSGWLISILGRSDDRSLGLAIFGMNGMIVYILALSTASSGFIELLRRGDFQKPLPFTPAVIVFWEVAGKAIVPVTIGTIVNVVALVAAPQVWSFVLASFLATIGFTLLLTSTVLLVVLLFPDLDDPTQRGFRQLMMMLGIVTFSLPSISIIGVLYGLLHWSPVLAAIPAAVVAVAISIGLCALSGGFYSSFNPNE